ncbi:MAG: nicotinate (nicotinamide) nucleotide adenylyltransferase [Nanoarchaeota archaeon]|nr:nicotinate (nicotinamide) nucleotide adenylyltransferase [Nanoarchaeota archaeon]
MKVALFGGSFNPIHNGHLEICNEIISENIADEVWIVPCGNHAFGKDLAPADHRIKMIDLVLKENGKVKLIDIEVKSPEKSYTSQTIEKLKKQFPHDFYLVIGADNLKDLTKWHNFEYLKNNVAYLLINRPEFNAENELGIKISSFLKLENNASSTEIRENVRKKISIKGLVPEEVESYIIKRRLYAQ